MRTTTSQVFLILLLNVIWLASFVAISQAQEPQRALSREDGQYDSLMRRLIGRQVDTTSGNVARHIDTIKVLRNWGKLKKGLLEQDVRKLLGSPVMIERDLANAWIIWSYDGRSVAFNSVTGKLSHWDELLMK